MFYFPPLTGVCRHLVILNVLFFIGSVILLGSVVYDGSGHIESWGRGQLAVFFPGSEHFEPYQLFTHMFMHGDFLHLAFNMLGVYIFGNAVEALMGPSRFLLYYFICGLGALAFHIFIQYWQLTSAGIDPLNWNGSMWGASGAVFGLLAAFGALFPDRETIVFPILFPIKGKYAVLIFGLLELYAGIKGSGSGVAHFAHVGGAVVGMLMVLWWYGRRGR